MATHELKIKATVDTSQIQQELTRINQQREQVQNGPQNGAAQPGSKAMLNLDSTLKQLNRTLQQLASSMQKQNQTLAAGNARNDGGGANFSGYLGYDVQNRKSTRKWFDVWTKYYNESQKHQQIGTIDGKPIMTQPMQKTPLQVIQELTGIKTLHSEIIPYMKNIKWLEGKLPVPVIRKSGIIDDYNNAKRLYNNSIENQQQNRNFRRIKYGAIGHMASSYIGDIQGMLQEGGNSSAALGVGVLGQAVQGAAMGGALGGLPGAMLGGVTSAALELAKSFQALQKRVDGISFQNDKNYSKFLKDVQLGDEVKQIREMGVGFETKQKELEERREKAKADQQEARKKLSEVFNSNLSPEQRQVAQGAYMQDYYDAVQAEQNAEKLLEELKDRLEKLFGEEWQQLLRAANFDQEKAKNERLLEEAEKRQLKFREEEEQQIEFLGNKYKWERSARSGLDYDEVAAAIDGGWYEDVRSEKLGKVKQMKNRLRALGYSENIDLQNNSQLVRENIRNRIAALQIETLTNRSIGPRFIEEETIRREETANGQKRAEQIKSKYGSRREQLNKQLNIYSEDADKYGDRDSFIKKARQYRLQLKEIVDRISGSTDQDEVAGLQEQYQEISRGFNNAMRVIAMLNPEGSALQRMGLENLTSLASRGGWMGERNNTVNYLSKMDEQLQVLRKIDENTQDGMKSIYQ